MALPLCALSLRVRASPSVTARLLAVRCFAQGYKPSEAYHAGRSGSKSGKANIRDFRPMHAELPGLKDKVESGSARVATTTHYQALQTIADAIAKGSPQALVQAAKDRRQRIRQLRETEKQEDIFQESVRFLMEGKIWTYGNYAAYQRKLLDLMGALGWRRRLSDGDASVQHLEKTLKVLEAMTPVELASNHKSVFTREAVRMIAERSGTTVKFTDQIILEHDILRGDRKWYKIRQQFGKPLPRSFEDRQLMGEYDRPFSESEQELRDDMIKKEQSKSESSVIKPKRVLNVFYRRPSCGGNRWSTRTPRWYPAQWKMRQERRTRFLCGGQPRGNLGRFPVGGMLRP
jgi:hypothetical protein